MHDHVSSLEQDSANKPYYSTTWEAFSESVNATNNGLFFANISLASLADIDLERLSDSAERGQSAHKEGI
jgi:hypothetical protein